MPAFLAFIPKRLLFAAIGLAAALLALWGLYELGERNGRQQAAVEAARAIAEAYKDRSDENATVDALDRVDLCIELGGLPDDCAELRRVGEDPPEAADGGLSGGQ